MTPMDRPWQSIETAPHDGTEIELFIVHPNLAYERTREGHERWTEIVKGHWIDHNAGGFTWHGLCGRPTKWREIADARPPHP